MTDQEIDAEFEARRAAYKLRREQEMAALLANPPPPPRPIPTELPAITPACHLPTPAALPPPPPAPAPYVPEITGKDPGVVLVITILVIIMLGTVMRSSIEYADYLN